MIDFSSVSQRALVCRSVVHGRCRNGLVTAVVLILSAFVICGRALGDPAPQSEARALGDIFAESHIIDAALDVHQRALQLSPQERFEFLSHWVLPNDAHSSLRLDVGFSPTYPAAVENENPTPDGRRVPSGGELVCPALDLIDTAKQLGRLAAVRSAVEKIEAGDRIARKKRCAFRCLVELAENDMDGAVAACTEFLEFTDDKDPHDGKHRSDEMLLMLKAATTPELRDVMADYVRGVFRPARWPTYYDVWSRQLAKLAFRITPAMLEDKTSKTLNQVPQVVESPKFWTPVSFPLAARRGRGMPVTEWLFTPPQVINVANHGDDVVYFNLPLLGDLSVEADTTVSNWREAEMIVGARWVAPSYTMSSYDLGTPRRILKHVESERSTTRTGAHWYRHRTSVQGNAAVVSLDGSIMHRETFPDVRDPWIGVRSPQLNEGGAKNVRISGAPVIPETIDLIGPGLDSWIDYFALEEPWDQLTWRLQNGEITGPPLSSAFTGTRCEKALFYHRPMLEDGNINYEFYYRPGDVCAHPAIDRLCFVLNDDRVGIHWLTDGAYEQTAADPANLTILQQRSTPLPLKQDSWNHMQLNLRGDEIQLVLNGEQIAERTLHATNQRFFGFFYYADQEQLRIRNIRWRGEWPRTLPPAEANELAGSESDFLDEHNDHLRATFRHDFAKQGLPPELFRLASGEWDKDVKLTKEGLLTQAVTSRVTSVSLGHTVGGDFDIFARYTAFRGASEGAGARLMTRLQNPALHEVIGGRKHMIHSKESEENVGFLWFGFYDGGPYRYEYDKGQNIEETAGTVRVSRRNDTIYILTAETGSDDYRLHVTQKAGTEDLSAGGIQLQCEMPGASVIWTELEIHAERLQNCQQVLDALNSRDELWTSTELDFSKSAYDELLVKPADVKWIAGEGLRMQHTSDSGGWSTHMNTSQPLRGDFDVGLDFEIEKLTTTVPGESSLLAFQIELPDQERTRYHMVLFHEPTGVNRLAVHHQCFSARTGKEEGIESQAVILKTLTGLRIARRGQAVTVAATSPDYGGEFVLAQFLTPLPTHSGKLNVFVHTGGPNAAISVLLKKLLISEQAVEPRRKIVGWGFVDDPTNESEIGLEKATLTITAPDICVDNYPPGHINAPRVFQTISGDFTAQVNVIHVDEALPDSVHKSLGKFPTAYHAGTLLLRHNDVNCVRLERVSSNRAGQLKTICLIQIWKDKTLQFFKEFPVEDKPTLLKMERQGAKLITAFSQDEGGTWTAFPVQPFEDFPEKLMVGVSLTSNTEKGCEVQFRDFVLEKASE